MIPWELVATESDWQRLIQHHFPGDDDEHGSVLLCGVVETDRARRLLVREVIPAVDGVDYVAGGSDAYRKLLSRFIVRQISRAADEKLAYLAVHNHDSDDHVSFSRTDRASHERGHRALLDIAGPGPVGWLVLGRNSVAGDIRTDNDRAPLTRAIVYGRRRTVLAPAPSPIEPASAIHDRQVRLFGDLGQAMLSGLRVGIAGAGGAGSMIIQALVHLGVGELVVIDDDAIETSNLPRVVGSRPADARIEGPFGWRGTSKVEVARRIAFDVNPQIRFRAVEGDLDRRDVARMLVDCDGIFLAADTMRARHIVNAICHQYLIPGFQVGAKATTYDERIFDVFAVARVLGPDRTCMWCSGLVDPTRLQIESLTEEERRATEYVAGVAQPSVITMNAMSTALALNDFLFTFIGLHDEAAPLGTSRYHFMTRGFARESVRDPRPDCRECLPRKGYGDRKTLPVRP